MILEIAQEGKIFYQTIDCLFDDIYLYKTPHIESFEIDDEIDLQICEALLKYGIHHEDNN